MKITHQGRSEAVSRALSDFGIEDSSETTPVYGNRKKKKRINWRDVRLGFVRPLDCPTKIFVGKMDSYPEVVGQLRQAAQLAGMTSTTDIVGVADGGIGLSEELQRQFPTMQFILDKSHQPFQGSTSDQL